VKEKLLSLLIFLLCIFTGVFACNAIADHTVCRAVFSVPILSPDGSYWARTRSWDCMLTSSPPLSSVQILDTRTEQLLEQSPLSILADLVYWFNSLVSCPGYAPVITWKDSRTLRVDDYRCVRPGSRPPAWRDVQLQYPIIQAP
jgi:hypothetical protein